MENKRKSITEIKAEFSNADIHSVRHVMERYAEDDREGVKKLILSAEKKLTAHQKELDRMEHMFEYERQHADCRQKKEQPDDKVRIVSCRFGKVQCQI